ncbi:MAG: hypothetical protein SangKO_016580 [Sandaracinaceae bacterium]
MRTPFLWSDAPDVACWFAVGNDISGSANASETLALGPALVDVLGPYFSARELVSVVVRDPLKGDSVSASLFLGKPQVLMAVPHGQDVNGWYCPECANYTALRVLDDEVEYYVSLSCLPNDKDAVVVGFPRGYRAIAVSERLHAAVDDVLEGRDRLVLLNQLGDDEVAGPCKLPPLSAPGLVEPWGDVE